MSVTLKETVVNTVETIYNPFPGLRPFKPEESHLFFGRENQIEEVLRKLMEHKFIAIVGTSGIGKSSFMNCGIIPSLLANFRTNFSDSWKIISFRPDQDPVQNLKEAVWQAFDLKTDKETEEGDVFETSPSALTELIKRASKKESNFLIYVDQFEEIFRFGKNDEEAGSKTLHFINLLLNAANDGSFPAYVAITLRSDFVGDKASLLEHFF